MSSLLTIIIFLIAKFLHRKWPFILFVPVFFAVAGCILVLWLGDIPFDRYFTDNKPVTFMLGPAVVALGVLMFKQLPLIRQNLKQLLISIFCGSFLSVLLVAVLARIFSLPDMVAASLLPMGITTPIAIEVTQPLGGSPSITSVVVIAVGLFGNMISPYLLRLFKIDRAPAQGLSIGQTSHGIGTARAVQMSEQAGTFSGLAMSINGVVTVFTAPVVWEIFY